jgi:hypothetical protein
MKFGGLGVAHWDMVYGSITGVVTNAFGVIRHAGALSDSPADMLRWGTCQYNGLKDATAADVGSEGSVSRETSAAAGIADGAARFASCHDGWS